MSGVLGTGAIFPPLQIPESGYCRRGKSGSLGRTFQRSSHGSSDKTVCRLKWSRSMRVRLPAQPPRQEGAKSSIRSINRGLIANTNGSEGEAGIRTSTIQPDFPTSYCIFFPRAIDPESNDMLWPCLSCRLISGQTAARQKNRTGRFATFEGSDLDGHPAGPCSVRTPESFKGGSISLRSSIGSSSCQLWK